VIELSDVYVMEGIRPVEVVGFDMWKIPNDSWDQRRTDGFEPVLKDLHSLTLAGNFGILVIRIFLSEEGSLALVGLQVWRKNMRPQFILQSMTLRAGIVLDAHEVRMLHVIRYPSHKNWPAMAHFAIRTRPQSTGVDVSSLATSRYRLQHYLAISHSMFWLISIWAQSSDEEFHSNFGGTWKKPSTMCVR